MYRESIKPEEIEPLELAVFPGRITVIDKFDKEYDRAVRHLSDQRFVGFDTETKPVFTPHAPRCKTALLQLSSETEAFLFRLNKIGLPQEVAEIMADPYITKIGAAVNDDINGLRRYLNFQPERFVDLQHIALDYGIRDKSVRKMAAIILGLKVSKTQQLSNWEAPELSPAQQMYASIDAWICIRMYKCLLASPKLEVPLPTDAELARMAAAAAKARML